MSATEVAPQTEPRPRHQARSALGVLVWAERGVLPGAWIALIVIYSFMAPDSFPTWGNVSNILGSQAVLFVLALGALLPSLVGDFDLSLGGVMAVSGMVTAVLNAEHGWNIVLAALAGLLIAVACGAVNAFFIVNCDTNPLIITLGTGSVLMGVVYKIAQGQTVPQVSQGIIDWTFTNHFLGIPLEFFYGLALMLIIWYITSFTPLGLRALFVGQSRDVARLSGIRVARIRWGGFVLGALVSGLAGLLFLGTLGSADPTTTGVDLLPAYAAVFLGATTIRPGRFNAIGLGVAVYFLATGVNGLQILSQPSYIQDIFYGGALVVAVVLSRLLRRQV